MHRGEGEGKVTEGGRKKEGGLFTIQRPQQGGKEGALYLRAIVSRNELQERSGKFDQRWSCFQPKHGRRKHRVQDSVATQGKKHSQFSLFLQESYPRKKGFSSRSVTRFCFRLKNGIRRSAGALSEGNCRSAGSFCLNFSRYLQFFVFCRLVFIAYSCSLCYSMHQPFKRRGRKGRKSGERVIRIMKES